MSEYQSWLDSGVFELVGTRKVKPQNFVQRLRVLPTKRNNDETSEKPQARRAFKRLPGSLKA